MLVTMPSVAYKVVLNNGEEEWVHSPAAMPDPGEF